MVTEIRELQSRLRNYESQQIVVVLVTTAQRNSLGKYYSSCGLFENMFKFTVNFWLDFRKCYILTIS